jgi:hypothetical protein
VAKPPSGRFPFINLAKALERGQQIFDNDKSGRGLKVPVAFAAWDYSEKSSGGFQTVGALKQYGILEDEGSKDDRSVKLTQEARHYYLTEIDEERRKLRSKFATNPPLMHYMLEQWDYGTVDDAVARSHLKTVIGLNDQSARSALGVYKDNLSFVGVKGSHSSSVNETPPVETGDNVEQKRSTNVPETPPKPIKVGDRVQWTSQGQHQFRVPRVVSKVFCDADRGWFVAVQGQLGAFPIEQVDIVEQPGRQNAGVGERSDRGDGKSNPIEIFMSADNRLQITADIDREGVEKLRTLLDKYKEIMDLMS